MFSPPLVAPAVRYPQRSVFSSLPPLFSSTATITGYVLSAPSGEDYRVCLRAPSGEDYRVCLSAPSGDDYRVCFKRPQRRRLQGMFKRPQRRRLHGMFKRTANHVFKSYI